MELGKLGQSSILTNFKYKNCLKPDVMQSCLCIVVRIKKELQLQLQLFDIQWRISESNRWPSRCIGTLWPTEL